MTQPDFTLKWALLIFLCTVCERAVANGLSEAEDEVARARNAYYEAIRAGEATTPADRARLRMKVLAPAEQKLGAVVGEAQSKFFGSRIKVVENGASSDPELGATVLEVESAQPVPEGQAADPKVLDGVVSSKSGSGRPETVAPKNRGPSRPAASASSDEEEEAPAPAPGRPSNDGDGVEVIKFPGKRDAAPSPKPASR